jgi:hypothetical protein
VGEGIDWVAMALQSKKLNKLALIAGKREVAAAS